ncbi:hypothetical protein E4U21_000321 [Claviceps maximensis]|nr:hypothetical protein E4U21_000321 [Claviceps maximensis]
MDSPISPPSIPPPPPPPPPLNIPPSRARLQLAARLAMHQKNSQSAHPFPAAVHPSGGEAEAEEEEEEDDDDPAVDPFRDCDDDINDDDDDDDLDVDAAQEGGRGSWWRSMVGRKTHDADNSDEGDENEEEEEEEEEFGDFAMAEEDKSSSGEVIVDNLVLRPLPVNPAKDTSRGLSGLWPFGSRSESKTRQEDDKEEPSADDATTTSEEGSQAGDDDKAIEVKEATSRTILEEPDEDEVEVVGDCV